MKANAARAAWKEYRGLSKRIVPRRRPRVKRDVLMRAGTIEVVKRGASRYDFHDPYHIALEISWKGFALAFLGLDLSIISSSRFSILQSPDASPTLRRSRDQKYFSPIRLSSPAIIARRP